MGCVFRFVVVILVVISHGCKPEKGDWLSEKQSLKSDSVQLFTIVAPKFSEIKFANKLPETTYMNGLFYEYYYNGSGVAAGDFNNDGLQDIFFVSTLKANKLYLNRGGLKFKELDDRTGVSGKALFQTGVTTVDINNDGWLDIYVCSSGQLKDPNSRRNELYVNMGLDAKGLPYFEEKAVEYGLDLPLFSTQAAFFDYDHDGDLDMFLINHDIKIYTDDKIKEYAETATELSGDALYRNDNGTFVNVTDEAGILSNRLSFGLGLAIGDLNNDGWPDVYVSHDFSEKDHLYLNNGNGTFTESIQDGTRHISQFSMGNEIADYNNDGWLDIVTLDMMSEDNYGIKTSMSAMNPGRFQKHVDLGLHYQYMYNALQVNNGATENNTPRFSDVAQMAGISSTDWSWAPLLFDMDLDGQKDLFVSNGIKRDFRNKDFVQFHQKLRKELEKKKEMDVKAYVNKVLTRMPTRYKPNYFFRNRGDLTFKNQSGIWDSNNLTSSNGAVYADLDNDGDLDIIVNNSDSISYIQKNLARDLALGNYLKIDLKGSISNRRGVGARVKIKTSKGIQMQEHYFTRGFQSSVAPGLHFGLGKEKTIDQLEIRWPDGKTQSLTSISANQTIILDYNNAVTLISNTSTSEKQLLFEDVTRKLEISYEHSENSFDDFERESLLPHKMSQFGPALAVADVNNDGLEDFFVGGAMGHPGKLYIQLESGKFKSSNEMIFEQDKQFEDVAALFFDLDGDGDQDLYVVSGGNEKQAGSEHYKDRVYTNHNGNFQLASSILPDLRSSGSCVIPFDYDRDGDLDLFVGGRQIPGKYPLPANSHLLQNQLKESGKATFMDKTHETAPMLENLGMVTDAVWADVDDDGLTDLVVVGEWMPITILKNFDGHFKDWTKEMGLSEESGWWYSIAAADFDNDGDIDLIGGNLGLNYKYKASNDAPFEIYTTDFDENGDLDIVLGYYDNGNLYPLRGRECSSRQMPFIKKKFPTYNDFGKATLNEVYGGDKLKKSTHYKAKNFASTYFENKKNRGFEGKKLPMEAQVSSVNSIVVFDCDSDGIKDILMAGNLYGSEIETPRNDASYGLVLKGEGRGIFSLFSKTESSLGLKGEVRAIRSIKLHNDRQAFLIAINNGPLKMISQTR